MSGQVVPATELVDVARTIDWSEPANTVMSDAADARTRLLIDGFVQRGSVDAHAEFTVPLPCTVFMRLCGLPLEDLDQFLVWKDQIIRPGTFDPRTIDGL